MPRCSVSITPLPPPAGDDAEPSTRPHKRLLYAYVLTVFLGWTGAAHFYLRRPLMGGFYATSLGAFGLGWLIDCFRMPALVSEVNKQIDEPLRAERYLLSDLYILWLPPWGILGVHHLYLERKKWSLFHALTLGFAVIGWMVDAFRLPSLVRDANETVTARHCQRRPNVNAYNLSDACYLSIFPVTGILGVHCWYLDNRELGKVYAFTLGLCLIAYLFDCFYLPLFVNQLNQAREAAILDNQDAPPSVITTQPARVVRPGFGGGAVNLGMAYPVAPPPYHAYPEQDLYPGYSPGTVHEMSESWDMGAPPPSYEDAMYQERTTTTTTTTTATTATTAITELATDNSNI